MLSFYHNLPSLRVIVVILLLSSFSSSFLPPSLPFSSSSTRRASSLAVSDNDAVSSSNASSNDPSSNDPSSSPKTVITKVSAPRPRRGASVGTKHALPQSYIKDGNSDKGGSRYYKGKSPFTDEQVLCSIFADCGFERVPDLASVVCE